MRTFIPLSVLALVGLGSCSSPAASPALSPQPVSVGCHADNDCKGDRICIAGACVSPSQKTDTTNTDGSKNPDTVVPPRPQKTEQEEAKKVAAKEEARKAAAKAAKEKEEEENSLYKTDKVNGLVEDKETGLVWEDSDNGVKVSWHKARELCPAKGKGWDLPKTEQLKTLYANGDSVHTIKEEPGGLTIRHPKEINITGYYLWSYEVVLLGRHYVIDLSDGNTERTQDSAYVLCVRTN